MRSVVPALVALAVLLGGGAALWLLDRALVERALADERALVAAKAAGMRSRLESELNGRLFVTSGLAAFVVHNPEITPEEFQSVGQELLRRTEGIRSVQLAKDSVVSHVYPVEGNRAAIGLRLLDEPKQRVAAQRAISSGSLVVAGPVELVQGGTALVARRPIFVGGTEGARYWGLATLLVDTDALFDGVGMTRSAEEESGSIALRFALRGKDGAGAVGEPFWGDHAAFLKEPALFDVRLPGGSWQLAAVPSAGWGEELGWTLPFRALVFLGLLAATVFTYVFTRNLLHLRVEHAKRVRANLALERRATELAQALAEVNTLSGLLPICSACKKIRDDRGLWNRIERYIEAHSDAQFTHGMCPACSEEYYGAELTAEVLERIRDDE